MKIEADDDVRITMGALKGLRGQVLKIVGGYATVQTRVGTVTIATSALEAV